MKSTFTRDQRLLYDHMQLAVAVGVPPLPFPLSQKAMLRLLIRRALGTTDYNLLEPCY